MEINFEYDNQTFHDLEMLNEDGASSVFSIFNNTLTVGGSNYLKQLMKCPITDMAELKTRVKVIQYLIVHPIKLNIFPRQFNYIEKYISFNVTILKSNPIDSRYHRVREWLRPTNDYYLLKSGCENLIQVLSELSDKLQFDLIPKELEEHTKTIQEFISHFSRYFHLNTKYSWDDIITLDRSFRIKFNKKLRSLLDEIYLIDAFISIAKTASKKSFTLPSYVCSPTPVLVAKGLRHPLLEIPITNDIEFGLNENMCFLTGPNMAGKSTFLKSVGIAVYLAHLGFPVPATAFKTSLYAGIMTTINLSDNLSFGHSHFYSEVNRVKEAAIAMADGKQMFVIFDELFRGTNVKDAFDTSTEIIKAFADINNCTFFISTHIVEIANELKSYSNISFKYFDSELIGDYLKYSYVIKNGVTNQRLGMHIIKKEGILEILNQLRASK